jgi:hypothetical protein
MIMKVDSRASAVLGLGLLALVSGCSAEVGAEAGDLQSEATASVKAPLDVLACRHFDAYDHLISENWNNQTVYSDKVDLLETNDPAYYIYNAYNYDYSGVCPLTFVTDVIERPNGNPAMRWRGTIKNLVNTGAMSPTRCPHIYFEWALYAQKFGGDGSWIHVGNSYYNAAYVNGHCVMPSIQSGKIDWKDGLPGIGKITGLRIALSAGEGDTKVPTCLALDGDDGGANLNALCPIKQY